MIGYKLQDLLDQIENLKQEVSVMKRKQWWLEECHKEQQMEIENLWNRIMNDFPVGPSDD